MHHRITFLKPLVLACILSAIAGCGEPSEDVRQNRRLTDALLTAVTTKSTIAMGRCEQLLTQRLNDGLLSERNYKKLMKISDMAKQGNWSAAEDALYMFREADPFPR